ncbi:MAG TPA: integrase core domain-containing protein [Actinomycetota bacterium]|nr:integrase core domain-containing protein [Actinomycetota bacterium]
MAGDEIGLRKDAVARVLSGEPAGKVAVELGRTERWVRKWVGRYDPADDGWAEERSRAPHVQPRRTPAGVERLVLEVRDRLMADPWAQVGAVAIAWELEKLGITPPEVWTIDRILRRAEVPRRRARALYVPKGTPYPVHSALPAPGAVHQADLVGPRHLEGGIPFYALNAVDVGRRRSGIEILPTKEEHHVALGLVRLWARMGIPKLAQFDNGQTIAGRGRSLALAVRLCLHLGVRARFIPFGEPWRNAVVEHFNDVFDKRFFRTERFESIDTLMARAAEFETFHNARHRYSALKGATPDEWGHRLGFVPRRLDPTLEPPTTVPRRGRVEFVRLIRSDRLARILGAKIVLPTELVHRYVTATLHVRDHRLVIEDREGFHLEVPFPLNR